MITLITGTPGAGKTALAVAMLLEEQGSRPLFISGIPDLKISHEMTPPVEDWTQDIPTPEDPTFTKPVFTFPPNSIIVIDEAQNVYRPRASTAKVPPYVAAFETHRHTGVDFWLITQHPGLLDSNIRKLVGRHVHIRNTPLGRYLYEWPECGEPESKTSRQLSASRRYKLPKKVFGLYKSATVHIKQKARMPMAFYGLVAAFVLLGLLGWRFYSRVHEVTAGQNPFDKHSSPASAGPLTPGQSGPSPSQRLTSDEYVETYRPRVPNHQYTASAYDDLTKPSRVPVPAACLATKTRCTCYTQDATPYQTDDDMCRRIVAGGIFFAFDPAGPQSADRKLDRSGAQDASAASGQRVADVLDVPRVVTIQDRGDFVGVSSRTRDQLSPMSTDRTYQESIPGDQQAFAPRSPGRF